MTNRAAGRSAALRAGCTSAIRSPVPSNTPQHSSGAHWRACATTRSSNSQFTSDKLQMEALDRHRDAHAAADAERGNAVPQAAIVESVDERRQDARTARADRMPERDRA